MLLKIIRKFNYRSKSSNFKHKRITKKKKKHNPNCPIESTKTLVLIKITAAINPPTTIHPLTSNNHRSLMQAKKRDLPPTPSLRLTIQFIGDISGRQCGTRARTYTAKHRLHQSYIEKEEERRCLPRVLPSSKASGHTHARHGVCLYFRVCLEDSAPRQNERAREIHFARVALSAVVPPSLPQEIPIRVPALAETTTYTAPKPISGRWLRQTERNCPRGRRAVLFIPVIGVGEATRIIKLRIFSRCARPGITGEVGVYIEYGFIYWVGWKGIDWLAARKE